MGAILRGRAADVRALDLVGKRYSKLVALSSTYIGDVRGWRCLCDCGGYKDVPTFALTSGNTTSCGCATFAESIIGNVYGRLTVIKCLDRERRMQREVYLCTCSCGNDIRVPKRYLQRGSKTHCGCVPIEFTRRQKPEEPQLVARIRDTYARNASKYEREFGLSVDQFRGLITSSCHYCAAAPKNQKTLRNVTLYWNGIDRRDNNAGYVDGNVVTCCSDCNYMKSDRNYDEFVAKIKLICDTLEKEK